MRHGDAHSALSSNLEGSLVSRVGVTDDAHPRVGGQDALESSCGFIGSVCDDHHAGVL